MHDHDHDGNDHQGQGGHRPGRRDRHHHADERTLSGYELAPAAGHNAAPSLAQWQEPRPATDAGTPEADFDLVETAFAESFPAARDPTSFLRLARIPFVGRHSDGRVLRLLRVEYEQSTDVGALTLALGGNGHRHDPLPAALVSTRRRLRFAYFDGDGVVRLTLAKTRLLGEVPSAADPATPPAV
jgi:hypothetical protein